MIKQRQMRLWNWSSPLQNPRQRTPIQTTTELSAPAMACVHGGALPLPPIEPIEIPQVTWLYDCELTSLEAIVNAIDMGYEVECLRH